jgi:hypothetical protein
MRTIIVVLLILWALGFIGGYTLSGFLHIILLVALVILVLDLLSGRAS